MKQIIILIILTFPLIGYSQYSRDSIDIKCDQCMSQDSNSSTNSKVACIGIAQEEWTAKMNNYYRLLSESLSDESVQLLYQSQEVWLNYKEAQISYLISFYYSDMSGGNHLERNEEIKNLIRKRALNLKNHYDNFKEE